MNMIFLHRYFLYIYTVNVMLIYILHLPTHLITVKPCLCTDKFCPPRQCTRAALAIAVSRTCGISFGLCAGSCWDSYSCTAGWICSTWTTACSSRCPRRRPTRSPGADGDSAGKPIGERTLLVKRKAREKRGWFSRHKTTSSCVQIT